MSIKKQPTIKISPQEVRNIVAQFDINDNDTDETYAIKKAMNKLEISDKIIYCLYIELETKTKVAEVLGISRISTTRILKNIENHIKELVKKNEI